MMGKIVWFIFPILVWECNQSPSACVECDAEVNNLATLKIECKISNDHINCVFLDNYDKIEILWANSHLKI